MTIERTGLERNRESVQAGSTSTPARRDEPLVPLHVVGVGKGSRPMKELMEFCRPDPVEGFGRLVGKVGAVWLPHPTPALFREEAG